MTTIDSPTSEPESRDGTHGNLRQVVVLGVNGLYVVGAVGGLLNSQLDGLALVGLVALVLALAIALSVVEFTYLSSFEAKLRKIREEHASLIASERASTAEVESHLRDIKATLNASLQAGSEVVEDVDQLLVLDVNGSDRVHRRHRTSVVQERCHWRRVTFRSTGAAVSRVRSSVLGAGCFLVDVSESPTKWEGIVFFDPPIEPGDPREWTLELDWPGLADDLRANNLDTFHVSCRYPAEAIRLRVKYPRAWVDKFGPIPDSFQSHLPPRGVESAESADGDRVLTWTVEQPTPNAQYIVEMLRSSEA